MTRESGKATETKIEQEQPGGVNVQLVPADGSDCPVFANVSVVQPSPGVVIVDFGFLDQRAVNAVGALAREGKKVPEQIGGRLVARIALSYDAIANLHRQTAGVLQAVAKARQPDFVEKKK